MRFEMIVQHLVEPVFFFAVALDGIGHRLLGSAQKMMHLAEDRAHAAHLEHQPLQCVATRAAIFSEKFSGFLGKVYQDGAGFEYRQRFAIITLGIDDGGDFAVWVDGDKPGRELFVLADVDGMRFIRQAAFFEHDGNFAAVGGGPSVEVDHGDSLIIFTSKSSATDEHRFTQITALGLIRVHLCSSVAKKAFDFQSSVSFKATRTAATRA